MRVAAVVTDELVPVLFFFNNYLPVIFNPLP